MPCDDKAEDYGMDMLSYVWLMACRFQSDLEMNLEMNLLLRKVMPPEYHLQISSEVSYAMHCMIPPPHAACLS